MLPSLRFEADFGVALCNVHSNLNFDFFFKFDYDNFKNASETLALISTTSTWAMGTIVKDTNEV